MDAKRLAEALKSLDNQNFGPNDSTILSTINHPLNAGGKFLDWLKTQVNTAAGIPDQYDNPNPLLAPSPDAQSQAAFDLAGMAQVGSMPFAPKSAGGTVGTTLWHGSNHGPVEKIGFGDVFDGIFASPMKEAAESHGPHLTRIEVDDNKVLESFFNEDQNKIYENIKKWYPEASESDIDDFLYPSIVEDKNLAFDFDLDELQRITGHDDPGYASWSLQNDRGRLAKELGYDAVAMSDEHGTSYMIPRGSNAILSKADDNLNAGLIAKYLREGQLTPQELAQYETNAVQMTDSGKHHFNLANANAQGGTPESRAVDLGFDTPTFHASWKGDDIKEFGNRIEKTSLSNGLGVHSGTLDAAIQRGEQTRTFSPDTGKLNDDKSVYYPLTIKSGNEWLSNGYPMDEYTLENELLKTAKGLKKDTFLPNDKLAIQSEVFNRYDSIPYVNDVEAKGSISHISPPQNIRSRFAAFDPLRKDSANLLATRLLPATMLGYGMANQKPDNQSIAEALRGGN